MLRGYRRAWLPGDLLAGVTVAAYLVPQVMAYATIAGLPPVTGLWAAFPALIAYALLGSSRSLSMGPEATTALMTLVAIKPLAAGQDLTHVVEHDHPVAQQAPSLLGVKGDGVGLSVPGLGCLRSLTLVPEVRR